MRRIRLREIIKNREKFSIHNKNKKLFQKSDVTDYDQIQFDISTSQVNIFNKIKYKLKHFELIIEIMPYWKNGLTVFSTVFAIFTTASLLMIVLYDFNSLQKNIPLFYNHSENTWNFSDKSILLFLPIIVGALNFIIHRLSLMIFKFDKNLVYIISLAMVLVNGILIIALLQILSLIRQVQSLQIFNNIQLNLIPNFHFITEFLSRTSYSNLNDYIPLLPYILVAMISVFLITPLIGYFAKKVGVIDLPAHMRSRFDNTKAQRLHTVPKPRLGGLAIIIVVIVLSLAAGLIKNEFVGILIGVLILTISGFLDDKYELSPKIQMLFQIIAAFIVVISGIRIDSIDLLGFHLNLDSFEIPLLFDLKLIMPGDIFTILWIVSLINAFNWVCGIDALGESVSTITAITIGFISVNHAAPQAAVALMCFILAGAIIGFIPYNFPKAKILSGTIGDINFGFLLSSLAILSKAKFSTTFLLLILPIVDMIYVLLRRIIEFKTINPLKLIAISGRIHLHHRLIDMGFSIKMTLYFEITLFFIFALMAFYFEDIGTETDLIWLFALTVIIMLIFSLSTFIHNRLQYWKKKKLKVKRGKIIKNLPPEEKYKY